VKETRFHGHAARADQANFRNVLLRSKRIHHAFSMTLRFDSPSFVSPLFYQRTPPVISRTTAWFMTAS